MSSKSGLPLSSLLSQALVAFIIEFDNEFEHRMPHVTTDYGAPSDGRGPWLVSMVMWENCMRYVTRDGISVAQLEGLAGTPTNLAGMKRWGYIDSSGPLIRATKAGLQAQSVWEPLTAVIEERWRQRFGIELIRRLTKTLAQTEDPPGLPDCLPILKYGLYTQVDARRTGSPGTSLPALLSRILICFAMEYEKGTKLSLSIAANVLRVLNEDGVALRELPRLSGVSKEAVSMALGILRKGRLVIEGPAFGARGKAAGLTEKGLAAQQKYGQLVAEVEAGFPPAIRTVLEELVGDGALLFAGIKPYPDGWRAKVSPPAELPHYPMVLHRGGYLDGS